MRKRKTKDLTCSIYTKWSNEQDKDLYTGTKPKQIDFPFCSINQSLFGQYNPTPLYSKYALVRLLMKNNNYINSRSFIESFILYGYEIFPEVQEIINWINVNICCRLDLLDRKTIGVLSRIVAGKLNNLEKSGIISQKYNFYFHSHFLRNIGYYKYKIEEENYFGDLPF